MPSIMLYAMAALEQPSALRIFRGACFVVAAVAGLAGTVMLVAPEKPDQYFSWPIGPPPLAALVGAFYLASAVTFALLGRGGDWSESRDICIGILAFTLPTLVATAHHHDLFDWGRWQAVAWVGLFVGSPISFSYFLYALRGRVRRTPRLTLLSAVYGLLALGLLLAPGRLDDSSPFALPGLSGRFVGSWCAFLTVVALFNARMDRLVLLLWPAAALVAAARSFDDLQPASRRLAYLALLVLLVLLAVLPGLAERRKSSASVDN